MERLDALDEILDRLCERLESDTPFKNLLDGEVDLDFYILFLIQTYHYVRFTPHSLKLAADSLDGHPNPIYQSLRQRFKEHQAEEEGHDQWVLNDLSNLGQDPGIVNRVLPSEEIAAYNAYSKIIVKSSSPVAILGQAFILEGISNVTELRWPRTSPGDRGSPMLLMRSVFSKVTVTPTKGTWRNYGIFSS